MTALLPSVPAHAIAGGGPARTGEFPSAAYVQELGEFACGAVLVGERHVLTVASCVNRPDPATLKVVLGGHSLRVAAPGQRAVGVDKVVVHPKYDSSTLANNVAVIRLSEKVALTKRIQPAALTGEQPTGDVVLAGWGHDREGKPPYALRKVTVKPVAHSTCVANYEGVQRVDEGMMCVGGVEGKGGCQFDNGGPMYANGKLVGVISWGVGPCGQLRYPTVGSSVAHYGDWIAAQLT
ncbi:serine protease [Allokutzneria oryzae]|uniref:Serine protease n=1 Tax=Allokutzneria oryzae TaxID=1378989 RepID=A0ABV6A602_9PSEU